ncbi:gluconate 2-dehydrogenase subunit 3 family protein [Klebsiella pneumoniae]|nr:gluconate 2-dehydrogenase subunit 3 family protein [Klebsiella pneumoniae]
MMSSEKTNNSRRDFLVKSISLIPTVVIGGAGAGASWRGHQRDRAGGPCFRASLREHWWRPATGSRSSFNDREWAFINAAVARLIPADELGPGAKEAGVPEFIDRQLNTPYATRLHLAYA